MTQRSAKKTPRPAMKPMATDLPGVILLCLTLCFPVCAMASGSDSKTLHEKRQALKEVKHEIQRVSKKIHAGRKKESRINQALKKAETRIASLKRDEDRLQDHIAQQNKRIAATKKQRGELRQSLQKSRDQLSEQVRAAYQMGSQGRLKLFLSQKNPATVGRLMSYYQYFIRAQNRVIQTIQKQTRALKKTQSKLQKQRAELKTLSNKHKQDIAQLQTVRKQRQQALGKIREQLRKRSSKLASLKENRERLENLIGSLTKALARVQERPSSNKPFPSLKKKLSWPLHGHVLAHYGEKKMGSELRWEGLWIAAKQGAPVRAVANGRVVYVGWMPVYGLFLILDHGHSYYSLYAHDQSVLKQTGDSVRAGEKIATAGKTGGHDKSGVYLEIRKGTKALDPSRWLRSR